MNFFLSQLNKGLFNYDLPPKGGEESDLVQLLLTHTVNLWICCYSLLHS